MYSVEWRCRIQHMGIITMRMEKPRQHRQRLQPKSFFVIRLCLGTLCHGVQGRSVTEPLDLILVEGVFQLGLP